MRTCQHRAKVWVFPLSTFPSFAHCVHPHACHLIATRWLLPFQTSRLSSRQGKEGPCQMLLFFFFFLAGRQSPKNLTGPLCWQIKL